MSNVIIWDGHRRVDTDDPLTLRIGELPSPYGPVPVYRDNIAEAYAVALGQPPSPPPLLPPGRLEPQYGSITVDTATGPRNVQVVVGYTYDQGAGDYDKALAEMYTAEVAAWSAHAAELKNVVDVLLRTVGK